MATDINGANLQIKMPEPVLKREIEWFSVNDKLPELEEDVIVCTDEGWVTRGRRAEINIRKQDDRGMYYFSNEKHVEWGYEENDYEYWQRLNVVYWTYFPDSPFITSGQRHP